MAKAKTNLSQPDGKLIAQCERVLSLQASLNKLYTRDDDDDDVEQECSDLLWRQNELMTHIAKMPARTEAGLTAKAKCALAWPDVDDPMNDHGADVLIALSLARDLLERERMS